MFIKNGERWNIIIELIIRILFAKLKLKPIVSFALLPGVFANKKFISKIKYDIIVSNPPYLSHTQYDEIPENVKFEPDIALFAPSNNPLYFYEKILEFSISNLNINGQIYLEINPVFIEDFNKLLLRFNPNDVNFRDDFRGKKRLVKVSF